MILIKPTLPEGTRDFTTEECIKRNEISLKLLNLFNLWGYKEISTPTIEFYNTFNYKDKSLREEEMYKFFDNNGRILVLRPDMTIPVARMVSTKLKDMAVPIKLCYSANIYRVNESLIGRQNEFKDCGVELIGVKSKKSDLEILVTALEAMKKLNYKNLKLEIGSIKIFKAVMKSMNLSQEQSELIADLINEKSLTSLEDYIRTLEISEESRRFLIKLPWLFGEGEVIAMAKEYAIDEAVRESIYYLEGLYKDLCSLGYKKYIVIDMAMVPRLNYYTGIIFRGYVEGIGKAILTGGRYDNLLEEFGRPLSAVGFSLKLDLIVDNYNEYSIQEFNNEEIIDNIDEVKTMKTALTSIMEGKRIKIVYEEGG